MQVIDNIISDCNKKINEKVIGINYLEQLKYNLIDFLKSEKNYNYSNISNEEITKQYKLNKLFISLKSYTDSFSKIKTKSSDSYLSIVLEGFKTIKIYQNSNIQEINSIKLYKNSGIVMTKDTIFSESISKGAIVIDILNLEENHLDIKIEKTITI